MLVWINLVELLFKQVLNNVRATLISWNLKISLIIKNLQRESYKFVVIKLIKLCSVRLCINLHI